MHSYSIIIASALVQSNGMPKFGYNFSPHCPLEEQNCPRCKALRNRVDVLETSRITLIESFVGTPVETYFFPLKKNLFSTWAYHAANAVETYWLVCFLQTHNQPPTPPTAGSNRRGATERSERGAGWLQAEAEGRAA